MNLKKTQRTWARYAEKRSELGYKIREFEHHLSFKGTQYTVIRFIDGTYGVQRGFKWILHRDDLIDEVIRRGKLVFETDDVKKIMES